MNLQRFSFGAMVVLGGVGLQGLAACTSKNGNAVSGTSSGVTSSGTTSTSSGSSTSSASSTSSSSSGDSGASSSGTVIVPPDCPSSTRWAAAQTAVAGLPTGTHFLAGMSTDELTIAWMDSATAPGPLYVAERTTNTAAFGAAQTIAGPFTPSRATIAADGRSIIVATGNGQGLGALLRASRTIPFTTTLNTAEYADMFKGNPEMPIPPNTVAVADPLLSDDGLFLYFTQTSPTSTTGFTFKEAYRPTTGSAFPSAREMIDQGLKQATGGQLRRPTGMSPDKRTLFYWDETNNTGHAAFRDGVRDAPANLFGNFVDLGDRRNVAPSAKCERIYFTAGAGSVIYVANKQ